MKLLEKKTINESIQSERKTQIDSGIFLAKKVDKLREELLNLEKQRTDFIRGSQDELNNALTDLQKTRDNLTLEVKLATKQLATLREPLDEEWEQLKTEKAKVETIKEKIQNQSESLEIDRETLTKNIQLNTSLLKQSILDQDETNKLLQKAQEYKDETKGTYNEIRQLKANKEVELSNKETILNEKEKNLKEREQILVKERLELNKEKKLLAIKKQRIQ